MRAEFDFPRVSIRRSEDGTFVLSIPVVQGRGVSLDLVTVGLDISMVAEPPRLDATFTQSLGLSGPSLDRQVGAYVVAPNRRAVSWTLPHFGLRRSLSHLEVRFSWKLASLIPDRVAITVSSSIAGMLTSSATISGLNVSPMKAIRNKLTGFLSAANNSDFIFSDEGRASDGIVIAYGQLSGIVATAQRFPHTAVSGTTWPAEMDFWASDSGSLFLAYQYANLRYRDGKPSLRLALCPFSLGVRDTELRNFLVELEVQSRLGVQVRLLSAEQYISLLSSTDALMSLGSQIGVHYGAAAELSSGEPAETRVYLSNDAAEYGRHIYKRAFSAAEAWESYKDHWSIIFNRAEVDYIMGRQLLVDLLAQAQKAHLLQEL